MKNRTTIRWMARRDLPDAIAIDRASFDRCWSSARFLRTLRLRGVYGLVAERSGLVVAFAVYEFDGPRISLSRLAVHPSFRREGIGRQLLDTLTAKAADHERTLNLWVRETNLDAQLWLRACGVEAVGGGRGHYADTGEDGYLFRVGVPAEGVQWAAEEATP